MDGLNELLTPVITAESRAEIAKNLIMWFAAVKKAPVHDLEQRTQTFVKKLVALSKVLLVNFTDQGYVIDPGVELQTYTAITRGSLWFDGDAEQVNAVIIATALEGTQ